MPIFRNVKDVRNGKPTSASVEEGGTTSHAVKVLPMTRQIVSNFLGTRKEGCIFHGMNVEECTSHINALKLKSDDPLFDIIHSCTKT